MLVLRGGVCNKAPHSCLFPFSTSCRVSRHCVVLLSLPVNPILSLSVSLLFLSSLLVLPYVAFFSLIVVFVQRHVVKVSRLVSVVAFLFAASQLQLSRPRLTEFLHWFRFAVAALCHRKHGCICSLKPLLVRSCYYVFTPRSCSRSLVITGSDVRATAFVVQQSWFIESAVHFSSLLFSVIQSPSPAHFVCSVILSFSFPRRRWIITATASSSARRVDSSVIGSSVTRRAVLSSSPSRRFIIAIGCAHWLLN